MTPALDQFYTNQAVAEDCLSQLLKCTGNSLSHPEFIEPAAGDGAFYNLLPARSRIGIDMEPRCPGVSQGDFLNWQPASAKPSRARVIVGNPPFGKRGKLALEFVRHGARFADTIALIVPMCFTKFGIHRHVPADLRLVEEIRLPENAFHLPNGKPYDVNAVFQVWTRLAACRSKTNLRILTAPPTKHADFLMYQYNNTAQAERYFELPFDFAVPCQGWQDYSRKVNRQDVDQCERTKQWMLIEPITDSAKKTLRQAIDYHELAHRNATTVPGFRKHDLVAEYDAYQAACG